LVVKRKLLIALVAGGVISTAAAFGFYYFWIAAPPVFPQPRLITVRKGESFRAVADDLARAGVVRSSAVLMLYAEMSDTTRRVQPGEYAFKGGERIPAVMGHLVRGDFLVVTVTIPEGLTVHQIAERLGEAGLVCPPVFEAAARRGALVDALGLAPLGAEGYLFPATYRFPPNATVTDILAAMLGRFYEILTPRVEERMFELGLTPRKLVTMASMIEKEAKAPGERKLIASVFYNRLRLDMPLQSDPTAEYSLEGEKRPAALAVRTPSIFNTYDFTGLPPGPIANPGLGSIEAALYPARTNYLYFVARDDGTHIFSRTYEEHLRAIADLKRKARVAAPRSGVGTASGRR
jgi:UPF0755 protein